MAITVRFPNGQAIHYNNLNFVTWAPNGETALLRREKDSGWSVAVPRECVIEFAQPCSVSNPLLSPQESIDVVIANIRSYDVMKLKQLKTLLETFDRRIPRWKE